MRLSAVLALVLAVAGCGGRGPTSTGGTTAGTTPGRPTLDTAFVLTGNLENANGAAWTFSGTVDGVAYDLTGVLHKPHGSGPFPAVVLSHGHDGTAPFYASMIAPTMVS